MKKKIVSLLLAAAASVSALAFAACDEKPADEFTGLKSDKVASAEAWAAAFDYSEVTNASIWIKEGGTYYGLEEGEAEVWYSKLDNEKLEEDDSDGNPIRYYEYKADELIGIYGTIYYYTYNETSKKWTYEKESLQYSRTPSRMFKHYIQDCNEDFTPNEVSTMYLDFKYDEKNYAYVATFDSLERDGATMENVKLIIKIKDGKIVEGAYDFTLNDGEESGTISVAYKIYDVGSTGVEIPSAEPAAPARPVGPVEDDDDSE